MLEHGVSRYIDGPVGDIETIRGGRNGLLNDNRVMYYIAYGRIQIAGLAQMIGSNAQALDLDPNVRGIAAGGTKLHKLLLNGEIYQHDDRSPLGCGTPDECKREWKRIDANSASAEIVAEE
jgi:hypothetical protein